MEMKLRGIIYESKPEPDTSKTSGEDYVSPCTGCAFEKDSDSCRDAYTDTDQTCSECGIIWVKKDFGPIEVDSVSKATNPKDAVGVTKSPLSVVPTQVIHEVGVAMLEGALKYGRHNYRDAGVRASVYYDATQRHLDSWFEGEDLDPDSGLSHITKAIASLMVLRDAMMNDMVNDDRPPKPKNPDWMRDMNKQVQALLSKYPEPKEAFTEKGKQ